MELLFKLSARNIWRHRGQSFVIGAILFVGALLMTVGNGVVSGMDRGLQKTIVRGFTGDLVLVPDQQESDNVFLQMMGRAVEPLYNYPAIREVLDRQPQVARHLPMGKNLAMVLNEEEGAPTFLYLLGVDFRRYRAMFPDNVEMLEGSFPEPGKPGLLLAQGARKTIHGQTNMWYIPKGASLDTAHLEGDAKEFRQDLIVKSDMVLMGFSEINAATDVRLAVDGIFRYRALNTIFGNFALVDIESYRQCLGYFLASEKTEGRVSERDSALLSLEGEGLENLFSEDALVVESDGAAAAPEVDWSRSDSSAKAARTAAELDEGAYNTVLIMLREGADAADAMEEINAVLKAEKLGVRAVTWKSALGPVGSMAVLIKGALFVFVSFLFVVAVIIIINTLTMAALERTPELGMMRAIGARKGFIGAMFLAETAMLSLLFGGAGILAGIATVWVLALLKISSDNDMLQLFFGGDVFRPVLSAGDIGLALVQLAFVTLAAVFYPVLMARRMSPLDAVYKE